MTITVTPEDYKVALALYYEDNYEWSFCGPAMLALSRQLKHRVSYYYYDLSNSELTVHDKLAYDYVSYRVTGDTTRLNQSIRLRSITIDEPFTFTLESMPYYTL
jgi:hypothetical protein